MALTAHLKPTTTMFVFYNRVVACIMHPIIFDCTRTTCTMYHADDMFYLMIRDVKFMPPSVSLSLSLSLSTSTSGYVVLQCSIV